MVDVNLCYFSAYVFAFISCLSNTTFPESTVPNFSNVFVRPEMHFRI